MVEKLLIVKNRAGIHARPAAIIAQTANKFESEITICCNGATVNAKSIMGVIAMGAAYETQMTFQADGPDESEAIAVIEQLFESKFEEE